jgi:Ran GTPase-activating protein (RanGAP) involved in mRNA processing and transport
LQLDLKGNRLDLAGAAALALGLAANSSLTMLSLAQNGLGEEGTKAICEALEQNKTLKKLDINGVLRFQSRSAGAKHVAKMLVVNGALTEVWETCQPTAS